MGREVESQGPKKAGQGSPSLFQVARITATKGVGSLALRRCSVPSSDSRQQQIIRTKMDAIQF
jgi:hypothetical protein